MVNTGDVAVEGSLESASQTVDDSPQRQAYEVAIDK